MRVLKYGKIQPKKVLCPECESLLEYNLSDLDYSAFNLICKFDEDKIGLKCPVCNRMMLLELYKDGHRYVREEDGKLHIDSTYGEDM